MSNTMGRWKLFRGLTSLQDQVSRLRNFLNSHGRVWRRHP
jgi:hypothetical protein